MRPLPTLVLLALATLPAHAQTKQSVLFTGRFPFVSLDQPNERAGGAMTALSEFDISIVTPGTGAFARSWLPATALAAMMGNGNKDGDHTRFWKWKTYFERFNFAGPFVKYDDRAKGDPRLVYLTTRDNAVNKKFDLLQTNGTTTVAIGPGDFFRFLPNGNTEFFITQALIMKAAGPQTGSFARGASAICQDAAKNLYYSPAEGGHWISGNDPTTPKFFNDGSIVMIDFKDITYDAKGNVVDVTASSAHTIFGEVAAGPNGQVHIRNMVVNAGAFDYNGTAIATTTNMVGLALDPNGGTQTASWPIFGNPPVYPVVPHFIFAWDSGGHAATIFSTRNNTANQPGSIAVINGVKCGSDVATTPADGSWLGCKQDKPNFQPTVMGLAIIDEPKQPFFVMDAPNEGAIELTDAELAVDFQAAPFTLVYALLKLGPAGNGTFAPSVNVAGLVVPNTWDDYFMPGLLPYLPVGVTDGKGYATWKVPNFYPAIPGLKGTTLLWHGIRIDPVANPPFHLSPPAIQQFK